ncbi:MAG: methylenetetrahydrofolate reductase [NAD(P)H] [bacterium]
MKVIEALNKNTPTLSFEFFPPKTPDQEKKLFETLAELKAFKPDFVSVTYGAMGTTREKTFFWVKEIKEKYGIEPVAHLTCIAAAKDDIAKQLDDFENIGVTNLLALRGDPPEGEKNFIPPQNGFKFAKELIDFIKNKKPDFCLGVAGFPEGHPKTSSVDLDVKYLKEKISAGGEYVISQLFFDNRFFFDFTEKCQQAGINIPIIAGLMPITSLQQIKRLTDTCGASIPAKLQDDLKRHAADPRSIKQIGIDQASKQAEELLKAGVPGIHFFVMNQAGSMSAILNDLPSYRSRGR